MNRKGHQLPPHQSASAKHQMEQGWGEVGWGGRRPFLPWGCKSLPTVNSRFLQQGWEGELKWHPSRPFIPGQTEVGESDGHPTYVMDDDGF